MSKSKATKASKKGKTTPKSSTKAAAPVTERKPSEKAPKTKSKSKPVPEPVVEDEENEEDWEDEDDDEDDDEEDSDEEFDGVDEEGMERLLKALGDNGLDEFDQAQLNSLHGDDSDEDDEEGSEVEGEDREDDAESGSDEEEDSDDEEEQEASPKASSSKSLADGIKALMGVTEDEEDSEEEDEDVEEDEGAIALDEADDSADEDAIPKRKVEIDNTVALERIRETIALDPSLPWTETLVVNYPEKIEVDVSDDLNRELAFYKQALHGANMARSLAQKHKLPFTRPADYFAEMVKSDAHMERIRQRLLNEKAGIKKSEDKRKEREGKKFGKQVQIEKLKEREKSKKEMEDRIKGLKRKRKDMVDGEGGDDFDVAVEDAISDKPTVKRSKLSRDGRNKKFGFGGGAGRHSKSNTRESTDDFRPSRGGGKGGRGGRGGGRGGAGKGAGRGGARGGKAPRPGKSKRQNSRR